MTSHHGLQTIAILILPNISRNKDNHTIRKWNLIECNMSKIIFEKSDTNCGGEKKWANIWINSLNFYSVCCIVSPSRWIPKYIETKAVPFIKVSKKQKEILI